MMGYMGLLEAETEDGRIAMEAFIQPGDVMVTGPQGSGTRFMLRILEAGGFSTFFDARHGLVPRPVDRVVVMHRELRATEASIRQNFHVLDQIPVALSLAGCRRAYPLAHWVDYDALCADPDAALDALAAWLGVPPWALPEPIIISPNSRRDP